MLTIRTYLEASNLLESILARIDRVLQINERMIEIANPLRRGNPTTSQTMQAQADIDAALERINRIVASDETSSSLLNGKGEIQSTLAANSQIQGFHIYRANMDVTGDQAVHVEVAAVASQAVLPVHADAFATVKETQRHLKQRVIFELASHQGSEIFTFEAQTSIEQVQATINLFTDVTGIEALTAESSLILRTLDFGSDAWVELQVIDEASPATFTQTITSNRAFGKDAEVHINEVPAYSLGNRVTVSTEELAFTLHLEPSFQGSFHFRIAGGGIQVNTEEMQLRLGVISISTMRLGGNEGKLFEIGTGQAKCLTSHPKSAMAILVQSQSFLKDYRHRIADLHANLLAAHRRPFALVEKTPSRTRPLGRRAPASMPETKLPHSRAASSQTLVHSGNSVLHVDDVSPDDIEVFLRR